MEISLALHMFAAADDDDDSSGLGQALTWAILALDWRHTDTSLTQTHTLDTKIAIYI